MQTLSYNIDLKLRGSAENILIEKFIVRWNVNFYVDQILHTPNVKSENFIYSRTVHFFNKLTKSRET